MLIRSDGNEADAEQQRNRSTLVQGCVSAFVGAACTQSGCHSILHPDFRGAVVACVLPSCQPSPVHALRSLFGPAAFSPPPPVAAQRHPVGRITGSRALRMTETVEGGGARDGCVLHSILSSRVMGSNSRGRIVHLIPFLGPV